MDSVGEGCALSVPLHSLNQVIKNMSCSVGKLWPSYLHLSPSPARYWIPPPPPPLLGLSISLLHQGAQRKETLRKSLLPRQSLKTTNKLISRATNTDQVSSGSIIRCYTNRTLTFLDPIPGESAYMKRLRMLVETCELNP